MFLMPLGPFKTENSHVSNTTRAVQFHHVNLLFMKTQTDYETSNVVSLRGDDGSYRGGRVVVVLCVWMEARGRCSSVVGDQG